MRGDRIGGTNVLHLNVYLTHFGLCQNDLIARCVQYRCGYRETKFGITLAVVNYFINAFKDMLLSCYICRRTVVPPACGQSEPRVLS